MNTKLLGFALSLAAIAPLSPLSAADLTWQGQNAAWRNVGNWNGATVPTAGDQAFFNDDAMTKEILLSQSAFISRLLFGNADDYTVQASSSSVTLQSANGIVLEGSGNVVVHTPISFGKNSNRRITGNGSSTVTLNGNIKGDSGLLIDGNGFFRVFINGLQESTAHRNSLANPNATLGGTGTLSRPLSISAAGSTLAPGTDTEAGTLTLQEGLSSFIKTNFDFHLGGTGGIHDRLKITGGTFALNASEPGIYIIHIRSLSLGNVPVKTPIQLVETTVDAKLRFQSVGNDSFTVGSLPPGWALDETYGLNGIVFDSSTGNLFIQFSTIENRK